MSLDDIRFSRNVSISVTSRGRKAPFYANVTSHLYGDISPLESEHRFPIGKFARDGVSYRKVDISYRKFQTYRSLFALGNAGDEGGAG
jgi:hypothetical protein